VTRLSSSFDESQRCSQEILSLEACFSLEEASRKLSKRTDLFSNIEEASRKLSERTDLFSYLEEPSRKLKRTNLFSKKLSKRA
jgi:hypothetical protein